MDDLDRAKNRSALCAFSMDSEYNTYAGSVDGASVDADVEDAGVSVDEVGGGEEEEAAGDVDVDMG